MPSSLPDDLDPEVLDRYLTGRSLPGDAPLVTRWLAADPARGAALSALRDQLRSAPMFNTDAMLERMNARIDDASRQDRRRVPLSVSVVGQAGRRWWLAAAAVVALLGAGIIALQQATNGARRVAGEVSSAVITTGKGERKSFTLGDGSKVFLAPVSRLTIYQNYGREQRIVALDGQAMFAVRHDTERPFRVRTPMGIVEDLGTEFDVRAYRQDRTEQVIVASGTVLVRAHRRSATAAVLQRNEMADVSPDGAVLVRRNIDAEALIGWVRGELVFDDAPLAQVAADLSRWYNADIQLGDTRIRDERLTATLHSSSLDHALEIVTQALGLQAVHLPNQLGDANLQRIVLRSVHPR